MPSTHELAVLAAVSEFLQYVSVALEIEAVTCQLEDRLSSPLNCTLHPPDKILSLKCPTPEHTV